MKKRPDVDALAASLTSAAAKPLQTAKPAPVEPPTAALKPKTEVKQLLLRLPLELYQRFDNIAIARTRETGRGVSIQQVIIERLAGDR